MCTLSWLLGESHYNVVFNRDELNTRQRAYPPMCKTSRSGVRFLSPTDTDAGGSWLTVNEYGLTACLINFYAADRASANISHSRGDIVLQLADCQSITEAEDSVRKMDNSCYKGFDLALFDSQKKTVQYRWDTRTLVRHTPVMPLTSSSYRTDDVCHYRRELFSGTDFSRTATKKLQQLLAFHNGHGAPNIPAPTPAYPPCMHREDAQTVSQCVVTVTPAIVSIRYTDGSPCKSTLSPPLTIARWQHQ